MPNAVVVRRVGSTLCVAIPTQVAKFLGIEERDVVVINPGPGLSIVIQKTGERREVKHTERREALKEFWEAQRKSKDIQTDIPTGKK